MLILLIRACILGVSDVKKGKKNSNKNINEREIISFSALHARLPSIVRLPLAMADGVLVDSCVHSGPLFDKELLIRWPTRYLLSLFYLNSDSFTDWESNQTPPWWKPIRLLCALCRNKFVIIIWVAIVKTKIFSRRFGPLLCTTYERLRTTECDGIVMKADSLCVINMNYRRHTSKSGSHR